MPVLGNTISDATMHFSVSTPLLRLDLPTSLFCGFNSFGGRGSVEFVVKSNPSHVSVEILAFWVRFQFGESVVWRLQYLLCSGAGSDCGESNQ